MGVDRYFVDAGDGGKEERELVVGGVGGEAVDSEEIGWTWTWRWRWGGRCGVDIMRVASSSFVAVVGVVGGVGVDVVLVVVSVTVQTGGGCASSTVMIISFSTFISVVSTIARHCFVFFNRAMFRIQKCERERDRERRTTSFHCKLWNYISNQQQQQQHLIITTCDMFNIPKNHEEIFLYKTSGFPSALAAARAAVNK